MNFSMILSWQVVFSLFLLVGCRGRSENTENSVAAAASSVVPSVQVQSLGLPPELKDATTEFQPSRVGWDPGDVKKEVLVTWSIKLGSNDTIYFRHLDDQGNGWQSISFAKYLKKIVVPTAWKNKIPAKYRWDFRILDAYLGKTGGASSVAIGAVSILATMTPILPNGAIDFNDFNVRNISILAVKRGNADWSLRSLCSLKGLTPSFQCNYHSAIDANPLNFVAIGNTQMLKDGSVLATINYPVAMGTAEDEAGSAGIIDQNWQQILQSNIALPLVNGIRTDRGYLFRTNNPCKDLGGVFGSIDGRTFFPMFDSIGTRFGSDWYLDPTGRKLLLVTESSGSSFGNSGPGGIFEIDPSTLRVANNRASIKSTFHPLAQLTLADTGLMLCKLTNSNIDTCVVTAVDSKTDHRILRWFRRASNGWKFVGDSSKRDIVGRAPAKTADHRGIVSYVTPDPLKGSSGEGEFKLIRIDL